MLRALNQTRGTCLARRVEVADSSETRTKGLLGRSGLEPDSGLWIEPCEWVHMFGMKFAIDIVVLDKNHRVVGVKANLRPGQHRAAVLGRAFHARVAGGGDRRQRHRQGRPHHLGGKRWRRRRTTGLRPSAPRSTRAS